MIFFSPASASPLGCSSKALIPLTEEDLDIRMANSIFKGSHSIAKLTETTLFAEKRTEMKCRLQGISIAFN
jgi:hypothetical protein